MNIKNQLGAAALALTMATPGVAAPINLVFSFDGVSGTFFGLDNADGISQATGFDFFGVWDNYIGVATWSLFYNSFEFLDGELISWEFLMDPYIAGPGGAELWSISLFDWQDARALEFYEDSSGSFQVVSSGTPTFISSAVPLPAAGGLLLTAFAALAAFRCRKKNAV